MPEDLRWAVISQYSHIMISLKTNKLDSYRSDGCIGFTVIVERYLKNLESNCLLTEVEPTLPPETSNFYWKRCDAEEKYKVFIYTPNRRLYYNLKEYIGNIQTNEIDTHGLTQLKKCVQLAVSEDNIADQPFINQMEFLIANFNVWYAQYQLPVNRNVMEICKRHQYRYYVLIKYIIDDIIWRDPVGNRGICEIFRSAISINTAYDPADVINSMNNAFELAAERFTNDGTHAVYKV